MDVSLLDAVNHASERVVRWLQERFYRKFTASAKGFRRISSIFKTVSAESRETGAL